MPPYQYSQPQRRLVDQTDGARIEAATIPRATFVSRKTRKTTFDAAYLYPFHVEEIYPGDHVRYNIHAYIRMNTPLFPLFDNQRVDTFAFFCPSRVLWENFVRMMGERANPGDSTVYTTPMMPGNNGGYLPNSLYDHMGLPTAGQISGINHVPHSALPLRMYNLVWNEWFRAEFLQDSVVIRTGDTGDLLADFNLLKRGKPHDYFTSALPSPQAQSAVTIPLGGFAPVLGIGAVLGGESGGPALAVRESDEATSTFDHYRFTHVADDPDPILIKWTDDTDGYPAIFADLASTTGVSINTLRQSFLVQQLLERDARGGQRYIENILSQFGVRSDDARLQRPEYIGGGQSPLIVTPIAQTAEGTLPVGSLGGTGTAAGQHSATYAATEHGYILWLINVRSELSYQQGQHKLWNRETRLDHMYPTLTGLGEQAILRREIFANGTTDDDIVFGYQERFHELRDMWSDVTGMFRDTTPGNIAQWHLAETFGSAPLLGTDFVDDNPPMARVLAAGEEAEGMQYLADIEIDRTITRQMPMFGTPVLLGRF